MIERKKVETKTTSRGTIVSIEHWDCPSCGAENTTVFVDDEIVYGAGEWLHFSNGETTAGCFTGDCFVKHG